MNRLIALRRRYDRVLSEPDQGTSLIELIVGMLIMTMFMAMFTSAVILMNRAENKADAVTQTSTQLNQAFLTLDKTVRYAAAISDPGVGTPSGDWYVSCARRTPAARSARNIASTSPRSNSSNAPGTSASTAIRRTSRRGRDWRAVSRTAQCNRSSPWTPMTTWASSS